MQMLANRTCANARPVQRAVRPAARPQAVRLAPRMMIISRAAEEATATAEAESTSNDAAEQVLSPIQKARATLEAEVVDKATLEAALAELDAEMARLQDAAASSESRAALLENSTATVKDQLLRLNADFDNFRRRSKEEKDSLAESVRGDVITQLLPLVDNFELARTQVKTETEAEAKINNSYQNLYKQMVEIMRGLGIESVPTVGAPFDPEIHEAIMKEPNNEVEDNTVLMEFRKGFRMGDRLLRAAMVKVSVNEGGAVSSSEE